MRKAFPPTGEKIENILCSLLPPTGTMKLLTDEKAVVFMFSDFSDAELLPKLERISMGDLGWKSAVLEKALGLKPDGTILKIIYLAVPNTSVFKGINIVASALMNLIKKIYCHQSK